MVSKIESGSSVIAANESVFAMAGYSVFRHADTEVEYCFIVEDNISSLNY